jgi:uncharacterized protein (DUF1697 family)
MANESIPTVFQSMQKSLRDDIVEAVEQVLAKHFGGRPGVGIRSKSTKARQVGPLTTWTANKQARRVPNFVIEATGLKIKKQVIAKYGEDSVWATKDGETLLNSKPFKGK